MQLRAAQKTQASSMFLTYAMGSKAINTTNSYTAQSMPSDPLTSTVNPTDIVYIVDIVSRQAGKIIRSGSLDDVSDSKIDHSDVLE